MAQTIPRGSLDAAAEKLVAKNPDGTSGVRIPAEGNRGVTMPEQGNARVIAIAAVAPQHLAAVDSAT